MKRLRLHIARTLLVALVLNMALASFACRTAYAHEHGHAHQDVCVPDDVVVQTKLPERSMIWKYEDFARWFSAANLSEPDQHRLSWPNKLGESPTILIMTLADYQKWVSSLEPNAARVVQENAVKVKSHELPSNIAVQRFENSRFIEDTMAPSEGEYVIIASVLEFCIKCAKLVLAIIEFRYGYSKWIAAARILLLFIECIVACPECGGTISQEAVEYSTQCPHQPWCMGQYAWVIRADGHKAECACECGAHWYEWY